MMRDLVEEKVADPIANDFRVNSGAFATGNLEVQIQSDVFDALEMRFSNDKSSWSGWVAYSEKYIWNLATGADGERTVYAEYRDEGHNTIRNQYTIIYDSTASDSPVISGTASPTNDATPTWTWSPSSYDVRRYRFRFDDPDPDFSAGVYTETTSTSFTPPPQADGVHTLYIVEMDIGDNISPVKSLAITVDTLAPVGGAPMVTGTTPTNDSTPTWSWGAVAEATRYRWSYNESSWTVIGNVTSFTPPVPLSNGSYTLYVQAGDDAGNWTGSGSFSIVVDIYSVGAPVVTSSAAVTFDSSPTWTWGAVSGSTNYRWGFTEGTWEGSGPQTSFTPASLPDGSYTLFVQAQNTVSSVWSSSGSFSVTVDTIYPSITVAGASTSNANPAFAKTGDTITLSFTVIESGSGLFGSPDVQIAGNTVSASGSGPNYTAVYTMQAVDAEGAINYSVSATDAAGNISFGSTGSTGITFDKTAPVVSGFTLNNGNTYSASPFVRASYSVTDNITSTANLKMRLQGGADTGIINYAPLYDISAPAGSVAAWFTDEAGNTSSASDTIIMKLGAIDTIYENQSLLSYPGTSAFDLETGTAWDLYGGDYASGDLQNLTENLNYSIEGDASLWDEDWYLMELDIGYSPVFTVSSASVIDGIVKLEAFYDAAGTIPVTVNNYTVAGDGKSISLEVDWDYGVDGNKNIWIKVSKDSGDYTGIIYNLAWGISIL